MSVPEQPRSRVVVTLVAALALAACETQPLAPLLTPHPGNPAVPSTPTQLAEVRCVGSRLTLRVVCGDSAATASASGVARSILVGGQDTYMKLTASNSVYDSTAQTLTFDVTLRNLIPQKIGTSDGSTQDPQGIRIFFADQPVVTSGTGTMAVANADGTSTFTSGNQPYFRYVTILNQYDISTPRSWKLSMPASVDEFVFKVYVDAPVQFPTGYVLLQSGNTKLRSDATRPMVATSKTAVGETVPGAPYAWATTDTTVATVDANGVVHGVRDGVITVTATDDSSRAGTFALTVTPITRRWTAGDANSTYSDRLNWNLGTVPTSQDSLYVPVTAASLYPVLSSNVQAGSLTVDDQAVMTVGAFSLTLTGDLTMSGSGLTASSGQIYLAGIGRTVTILNGGRVPRLRVTGTYAPTTNLTSTGLIQVDGGRLTMSATKLQVDNQ